MFHSRPDTFSRLLGRTISIGKIRVSLSLALILTLATIVNVIEVFGTSMIYQPDSGNYVIFGYYFAFHFDLSPVNLNRVPGYPIIEAPLFRLFGVDAMYALKVFQHGLMVVLSGVVVALGDQLDRSRRLGFLAGLFSCFALQLHSYAHQPMTELPYALTLAAGLLLSFRYVRGGSTANFLAAVAVFGVATLIRPAGVLLGFALVGIPLLRAIFPRWSYLWPAGGNRNRRHALGESALGLALAVVLWLPWPLYNLARFDHFGMTGTFGQNLWSNVVEYGETWDENSAAVRDIRLRWDEYQVKRAAQGLPPETRFNWRSHHPTADAYMKITGKSYIETNKVMGAGAVDSIAKYPERFLRHILHNLYVTIAIPEPTYLYMPDFGDDDIRPRWMKLNFDISVMDPIRSQIDRLVVGAGHPSGTVAFQDATKATPIYAWIAVKYHALAANAAMNVALVLAGGLIACILSCRRQGLPWLMLVAILLYLLVATCIVVPGAPRHRLPADPEMQLLYAAVALAVWRVFMTPQAWLRMSLRLMHFALNRHVFLGEARMASICYYTSHVAVTLLFICGLLALL